MNITPQVRAQAARFQDFWAEMRNTLNIMERSPILFGSDALKSIRQDLQTSLDDVNIIYPQFLKSHGIHENTSNRRKKIYLGHVDRSYMKSPETVEKEKRFATFMLDKAAKQHAATWEWRIAEAAQEMQKKGWYPFFQTLTLDPKKVEAAGMTTREFWQDGKEFRIWKRKLVNTVCKCLGEPAINKTTKQFPKYRKEHDYFRYAGVLEHGKTREHHHMHIMIWMREIPNAWKIDPNQGRARKHRIERECKAFRDYWPWSGYDPVTGDSLSPCLYFRTRDDVWSQAPLEHITPVDANGQAIKIHGPRAVGNYVMKYMQKGDKEWNHRIKATRNLGTNRIKSEMYKLDPKTIEALTWRPSHSSTHHSVSMTHSAPLGLVRSLAKRCHFVNQLVSRQLDLDTLLRSNYGNFQRMLKSVRDGARPDKMSSPECYDWVSSHLPDPAGYSSERILEAHSKLALAFPRATHRVDPTNLGGNDIGHS